MSTHSNTLQLAADGTLRETLAVSGSDLFALGHYHGNPIYPGVLLLDHFIALANRIASMAVGLPALAVSIKRVQYLSAVLPGDIVELVASVKSRDATSVTVVASASVEGTIRARATITCDSTSARRIPASTQSQPSSKTSLSHRDIARVLPHRYPFLLVDKVHSYTPGKRIHASKTVNRNSLLLGRNPPDDYPHGLVIESFGQAGIALFFLSQTETAPADILLGAISGIDLLHPVPYDTVLTLDVAIERLLPDAVVFSGAVCIGDEPIVRVGSLVAMIDQRHVPRTSTQTSQPE